MGVVQAILEGTFVMSSLCRGSCELDCLLSGQIQVDQVDSGCSGTCRRRGVGA